MSPTAGREYGNGAIRWIAYVRQSNSSYIFGGECFSSDGKHTQITTTGAGDGIMWKSADGKPEP